jgi:hypothetical protein
MSERRLATYLNDHLAGSLAAVELLGHLEAAHRGRPVAGIAAGLRAEIEADQAELKALIAKLGAGRSVARRAAAWLAEKAAELKLAVDDPAGGALRLLESFEAVSLGIEGKRCLWLSLDAASAHNPDLRGPDYRRLVRRAEEQRAQAEAARLDAARTALTEAHACAAT